MAERAGFEPAVRCDPYDDLANRCFRPLSHLSARVGRDNEPVIGGLRKEKRPSGFR